MGTSSRTLVAALLVGLDDMVHFIMDDLSASLLYLNGFSRLASDRRLFLTQAAVVSRVSEGVLAELLEEPRVAKSYPVLWHSLASDMHWAVTP
eukprot:756942-Lingulodinium_polyedra.AAC.1